MAIKLVWGITGAGDLLQETVREMEALVGGSDLSVSTVVSKAGARVLKWYRLEDAVTSVSDKVQVETDANTPFIVGPLQTGKYDGLLVAPATGNTVAKIVSGIADSLISNAVAQTNKARIPVFILPVDRQPGTTTTVLPNGKTLALIMRDVDLENTGKLRQMAGIYVIDSPEAIPAAIESLPAKKDLHG